MTGPQQAVARSKQITASLSFYVLENTIIIEYCKGNVF